MVATGYIAAAPAAPAPDNMVDTSGMVASGYIAAAPADDTPVSEIDMSRMINSGYIAKPPATTSAEASSTMASSSYWPMLVGGRAGSFAGAAL